MQSLTHKEHLRNLPVQLQHLGYVRFLPEDDEPVPVLHVGVPKVHQLGPPGVGQRRGGHAGVVVLQLEAQPAGVLPGLRVGNSRNYLE